MLSKAFLKLAFNADIILTEFFGDSVDSTFEELTEEQLEQFSNSLNILLNEFPETNAVNLAESINLIDKENFSEYKNSIRVTFTLLLLSLFNRGEEEIVED